MRERCVKLAADMEVPVGPVAYIPHDRCARAGEQARRVDQSYGQRCLRRDGPSQHQTHAAFGHVHQAGRHGVTDIGQIHPAENTRQRRIAAGSPPINSVGRSGWAMHGGGWLGSRTSQLTPPVTATNVIRESPLVKLFVFARDFSIWQALLSVQRNVLRAGSR